MTYFDIRRNGNVFFLAASVKIPEIFGVIRLVNLVDLEMITTERNKKYTYHWQVNWQRCPEIIFQCNNQFFKKYWYQLNHRYIVGEDW